MGNDSIKLEVKSCRRESERDVKSDDNNISSQ
jgi:hypothetical protein